MDRPESWNTTLTLFDTEKSRNISEKTFPVFGVPRGGTTAVAGCLQKLGVFIGDDLPMNLEDQEFAAINVNKRKVVQDRNKSFQVWGWKFPDAADYLDNVFDVLRNPRLIVVTRDLAANSVAITSRHPRFDKVRAAEKVVIQTQKNHALVLRRRCPPLFVSYEKLLWKTEQSVREIADFMGQETSPEQRDAAVSFVQPGAYMPVEK